MSPYVVGLFALAIASSSTMAIAQKSLIGYSSYRTYIVANFVMLLVAVGGFFLFETDKAQAIARNPWMIVLGIAVALLNLAYVRLFQQDINLSYVPLMVTGGMTLLLALVGMLYFQETINMQSAIGMVVILAGLGIMVWQ